MSVDDIFADFVDQVQANPRSHCIVLAENFAKAISEYTDSKRLIVLRNKAGSLEHVGALNAGWVVHCANIVGDKVYDAWAGKPVPVEEYLPAVYRNADLLKTKVQDWRF